MFEGAAIASLSSEQAYLCLQPLAATKVVFCAALYSSNNFIKTTTIQQRTKGLQRTSMDLSTPRESSLKIAKIVRVPIHAASGNSKYWGRGTCSGVLPGIFLLTEARSIKSSRSISIPALAQPCRRLLGSNSSSRTFSRILTCMIAHGPVHPRQYPHQSGLTLCLKVVATFDIFKVKVPGSDPNGIDMAHNCTKIDRICNALPSTSCPGFLHRSASYVVLQVAF